MTGGVTRVELLGLNCRNKINKTDGQAIKVYLIGLGVQM